MEVDVAGTMLVEDVLGDDGTQFRCLLALVEVLPHLFARDPEHAAGHHRHDLVPSTKHSIVSWTPPSCAGRP